MLIDKYVDFLGIFYLFRIILNLGCAVFVLQPPATIDDIITDGFR